MVCPTARNEPRAMLAFAFLALALNAHSVLAFNPHSALHPLDHTHAAVHRRAAAPAIPASVNALQRVHRSALQPRRACRAKAILAPPLPISTATRSVILLAMTIVLETVATTSMKLVERNPLFNVGVFGGYFLCFALFPKVVKTIPLGVAYAIWCGGGMVANTVIGTCAFGEALSSSKLASIALIILGVIGLQLSGGGH